MAKLFEDNNKLAACLDIAFQQRKRAAAAAVGKYGQAHPVTSVLSQEMIEIQEAINELRMGAELALKPPRK